MRFPTIEIDFNVLREILSRAERDERVVDSGLLQDFLDHTMKIRGTCKANHLSEAINYSDEELRIEQDDIVATAQERSREILRNAVAALPSLGGIPDKPVFSWDFFEIAQDFAITHGPEHWSALVNLVVEQLAGRVDVIKFGSKHGYYGNSDTWKKSSSGSKLRQAIIERMGFKDIRQYNRLTGGGALAPATEHHDVRDIADLHPRNLKIRGHDELAID